MKKTISAAIIEQLAQQNRRVLSDWRAVLLLRHATAKIPPPERRWTTAPLNVLEIHHVLRLMVRRGELKPIEHLDHLYEVTVPYAPTSPVEEDEILMEVHPYAALSHLSALVYHGLTDILPNEIVALVPKDGPSGLLPVGTEAADWEGVPLVRGRKPKTIRGHPVVWKHVKAERYFGIAIYRPRGYPVRVTTPERTLLDGLLEPERCGGFDNVLRAWALARDTLHVQSLLDYVNQFDIGVLRQRAGFLLEELGLTHPELQEWKARAVRGGSSKLLATAPYKSTYSEQWNLSINASLEPLHSEAA